MNSQSPGDSAADFGKDSHARIRPLNPGVQGEIELVAERMRKTLIEVIDEETGTSLYTMDWLRQRVRWHLDPEQCTGEVFLAEADGGEIVGHSIVRIEQDESGRSYGLFSTTYVCPDWRRHAIASDLLARGEQWMTSRQLPTSSTWTAATNVKLIGLFEKHAYRIVERSDGMVRLERRLDSQE